MACAFGVAAVMAIQWDAVAAAVLTWTNSTAHHALYLVIPASAYIIWLRRRSVASLTPRPSVLGLVAALFFGAASPVFDSANIMIGQQLAAVGAIQAVILTVLGWRIYRALLFPFMYLWLLVPAGFSIVPVLLRVVTTLSVAGVELAGVPVESNGNLIMVPTGGYAVVAECAALDFLVGALMISLFYGNLMYESAAKRVLFVLAALVASILANVFRVTTVILITHFSGGFVDLAHNHILYGWLLFVMITCGLVWGGTASGIRLMPAAKPLRFQVIRRATQRPHAHSPRSRPSSSPPVRRPATQPSQDRPR